MAEINFFDYMFGGYGNAMRKAKERDEKQGLGELIREVGGTDKDAALAAKYPAGTNIVLQMIAERKNKAKGEGLLSAADQVLGSTANTEPTAAPSAPASAGTMTAEAPAAPSGGGFNIDPRSRDLLIRTVIGESAGQPLPGQAGVAHVVLNRLKSGRYGGDVPSVLFAPKQFEPWGTRRSELLSIDPNSPAYKRAEQVVDGVLGGQIDDPTKGATHFQNAAIVRQRGNTSGMRWYQDMVNNGTAVTIGQHVFGRPDGQPGANRAVASREPAADMPAARSQTAARQAPPTMGNRLLQMMGAQGSDQDAVSMAAMNGDPNLENAANFFRADRAFQAGNKNAFRQAQGLGAMPGAAQMPQQAQQPPAAAPRPAAPMQQPAPQDDSIEQQPLPPIKPEQVGQLGSPQPRQLMNGAAPILPPQFVQRPGPQVAGAPSPFGTLTPFQSQQQPPQVAQTANPALGSGQPVNVPPGAPPGTPKAILNPAPVAELPAQGATETQQLPPTGAKVLDSVAARAQQGQPVVGQTLKAAISDADRRAAQLKQTIARADTLAAQTEDKGVQARILNRPEVISAKAELAIIERKLKELEPTGDIKEYNLARSQGYPGTYEQWYANKGRQGVPKPEEAEQIERSKTNVAYLSDLAKELSTSAQNLTDARTLTEIFKTTGTGKMQELKARFGPYLEQIGVNFKELPELQAAEAIAQRIAPTLRVPGAGAQSDFELRNFLKSIPSIGNTTEGNAIIGKTLEGLYKRRNDAAIIADRYFAKEISAEDARKQIRNLPDPLAEYRKTLAETGLARSPATPGQQQAPSTPRPGSRMRYNPQNGQLEEIR